MLCLLPIVIYRKNNKITFKSIKYFHICVISKRQGYDSITTLSFLCNYMSPKYFSKNALSFLITVAFFSALLSTLENLETGGSISSRSMPVVLISPSLKE